MFLLCLLSVEEAENSCDSMFTWGGTTIVWTKLILFPVALNNGCSFSCCLGAEFT